MIKAGIVGLGFIGPKHLEALRRLGNVEIAGIADIDERMVKKRAAELHVKRVYRCAEEMIKDPEVSVIHICAPNYLHYSLAKAALEAGKHVVCEKPLACSLEEASELVDLAEKMGRIAAVSYNLRYYPMVQQARMMVKSGELGEILSCHGSYLQDWLLFETDYSWRLESGLGGKMRALADIGAHWLDMIEYVSGVRIQSLCCDFATFYPVRKKPKSHVLTFSGTAEKAIEYEEVTVDTEDYASMLIRFENGARGTLTVSQMSAGHKNQLIFEMAGSRKNVCFNSEHPNQLWVGYREKPNELLERDPAFLYPEVSVYTECPSGHAEGFPDTSKMLMKNIYSAIQGDKCSYPTFEDGYRVMQLCEAAAKSADTGMWTEVEYL